MAIAISPWGAAAVRGRTGTDVYFVRRGRQFVKPYVYNNPPPTPAQQLARDNAAALYLVWLSLSAAQRSAWSAAAPPPLSGWNYYCRQALPRLQYGWSTSPWPPALASEARLHYIEAVGYPSGIIFSWDVDFSPPEAFGFVDIWAHGPRTPTQSFDPHYLRRIAQADTYTGYFVWDADTEARYTFRVRLIALYPQKFSPWYQWDYYP